VLGPTKEDRETKGIGKEEEISSYYNLSVSSMLTIWHYQSNNSASLQFMPI
jgi:hypothetical protein